MSILSWLKRRRLDDEDFDEEIQAHLAIAADERVAEGADRKSARLASLKEFGNVTLTTEEARRIRSPWRLGTFVASFFRDIRYSLRALRKTPAFTAGAIVTVALAVGTTTAIFSVVYGVLLRQLPYRNAEELFWIWSDQAGRDRSPFNVPDFLDYRDSTRTLSGFAGFFASSANLSDEAAAERVQGIRATGRFCRANVTCDASGTRSVCPAAPSGFKSSTWTTQIPHASDCGRV